MQVFLPELKRFSRITLLVRCSLESCPYREEEAFSWNEDYPITDGSVEISECICECGYILEDDELEEAIHEFLSTHARITTLSGASGNRRGSQGVSSSKNVMQQTIASMSSPSSQATSSQTIASQATSSQAALSPVSSHTSLSSIHKMSPSTTSHSSVDWNRLRGLFEKSHTISRDEIQRRYIPKADWYDLHRFTYQDFQVIPRHELGNPLWEYEQKGNFAIMKGDEEIGYVERQQWVDAQGRLWVHPGLFRLLPEYQQQGFGSAYAEYTEQYYREIGIDRYEITAIEIGAYLWASRNYQWNVAKAPSAHLFRETPPTEYQVQQLAVQMASELYLRDNWQAFDTLLQEGKIDEAMVQAFRGKLVEERTPLERINPAGKFLSPQEIALWGKEHAWYEGERKMWLGKYLLTYSYESYMGRNEYRREYPCSWSGVKFLT